MLFEEVSSIKLSRRSVTKKEQNGSGLVEPARYDNHTRLPHRRQSK